MHGPSRRGRPQRPIHEISRYRMTFDRNDVLSPDRSQDESRNGGRVVHQIKRSRGQGYGLDGNDPSRAMTRARRDVFDDTDGAFAQVRNTADPQSDRLARYDQSRRIFYDNAARLNDN